MDLTQTCLVFQAKLEKTIELAGIAVVVCPM